MFVERLFYVSVAFNDGWSQVFSQGVMMKYLFFRLFFNSLYWCLFGIILFDFYRVQRSLYELPRSYYNPGCFLRRRGVE